MPVTTLEYIGEMSFQLSKLARASKLDTLSHLLEMASLEAAEICERHNARLCERKGGAGRPAADARVSL